VPNYTRAHDVDTVDAMPDPDGVRRQPVVGYPRVAARHDAGVRNVAWTTQLISFGGGKLSDVNQNEFQVQATGGEFQLKNVLCFFGQSA